MRMNARRGLREPFNGASHLAGAALSAAGLVLLLALSRGRPWHVAGFLIYGMSLIGLYTTSGLYHSLHLSERAEQCFQKLDYIGIFVLIAGTYAPVCLIALRHTIGWPLLAAVYSIGAVGTALTLRKKRSPDWVRVCLYVLMGWLAIAALPQLAAALPAAAIGWLLAGGAAYSVGIGFYATGFPRLRTGRPLGHEVWHCFVLAGSLCHFALMLSLATRSA